MSAYKFNGPIDLAFRNFVVPSSMLGEANLSMEQGERERETQGGTFTESTGTFETASMEVSIFVPSLKWFIENFLAEGGEVEGDEANFIYNADECVPQEVGPLNISPKCEGNDRQDVHFYNAVLRWEWDVDLHTNEAAEVSLVFHANPDEDGNVARIGSGDLTQESEWDVDTQDTVAVAS